MAQMSSTSNVRGKQFNPVMENARDQLNCFVGESNSGGAARCAANHGGRNSEGSAGLCKHQYYHVDLYPAERSVGGRDDELL